MHAQCGAATPLRIPAELPRRALRRVVCDGCGQQFEPTGIEEVAAAEEAAVVEEVAAIEEVLSADDVETRAEAAPSEEPGPAPVALTAGSTAAIITEPLADLADRVAIAWAEIVDRLADIPRPVLPDWLYDPDSRTWKLVSAIAAAALVVGALVLLQGGGESAPPTTATAPAAKPEHAAEAGKGGGDKTVPGGASFVRESTFSLALPQGWKQSSGEAGATFSATAPGGGADATLWIERDPGLDFAAFEARSLDQLKALAGSARVVERTAAPTAESTIVRLAADAPQGSPQFEVTLRASGPYRYYLATTVQPDAAAADVDAAELIHGSFQPSGAPQ